MKVIVTKLHPKLGLPERTPAITVYSTCVHGLKRRRCPECQRAFRQARKAAA